MKNKKTKHVKNGVSHQSKPESSSNVASSHKKLSVSSTTLSVGALSVLFVSVFLAYQSDLLPKILPNSPLTDVVHSSGGWRLASDSVLRKYGTSKCTVPRRNAKDLTNEEFEKEYRFKKPVIVSFDREAAGWTNPESWSVQSLKQEYGEWLVYSGNSLEIVRRGGNGDVESSFTQFVDKLIRSKDDLGEPLYIFDRMFYNDSSLPSTLKPPKYFEIKDGRDDSIFFLGASSSGVSFHKHADAWNGVIYGEKRWFLYPSNHTPPGGVYPGFTQIEWYEKVYPKLTEYEMPMECIQKAGEILYLPEGTYHGTINLGDTVAIGIQKKKASLPGEKLFYKVLDYENKLHDKNLPYEKLAKIQKEILEIYEELHKMFPENTEILMKLGEKYGQHGKEEKGLELTDRALQKDKYFVLAYLGKADLLHKLGRIEEANEEYMKAVDLNTHLWDVPAQYGSFLFNNKRYQEAVSQFKKGIELNPKQKGFWSMLKRCQDLLGDTTGAQETERLMKQNFS